MKKAPAVSKLRGAATDGVYRRLVSRASYEHQNKSLQQQINSRMSTSATAHRPLLGLGRV